MENDNINYDSKISIAKKENDLMNMVYIEKKYIFDFYSIYDLKSLFAFANYDKNKIFSLLDNYSRDENMNLISEKSINNNSENSSNVNQKPKNNFIKYIIVSKTINELKLEEEINENDEITIIWKFLHHPGINLIDIKDALNSFDKNKLYNKIKSELKNSKNKFANNKALLTAALNEELSRQLEKKESEIFSFYINNFESNDIYYLKRTGEWDYYKNKLSHNNKQKTKNQELIEKTLYSKIIGIKANQRSVIFSFLDIFTLGKFGLCNKKLYELVYKEYNLNLSKAKIYVGAIFANSKLYEINLKKIKSEYNNSFMKMLSQKPRIKYCGIYYSKVKSIREYYKFGEEKHNDYVVYYRILRFFPNGNVYAMTCPHFKIDKIKRAIKENIVEFKKGRFFIDQNDNLNIIYTNGDEYIYKLGWSDFSVYKLGYHKDDPGIKSGIELISYEMKDKYGEKTKINLNENFPKRFRFRNIDFLEKDVFLQKKVEEIEITNEKSNKNNPNNDENKNNTTLSSNVSTIENSTIE